MRKVLGVSPTAGPSNPDVHRVDHFTGSVELRKYRRDQNQQPKKATLTNKGAQRSGMTSSAPFETADEREPIVSIRRIKSCFRQSRNLCAPFSPL